MRLVVIHDFTLKTAADSIAYERGHEITDPDLIAEVLSSENANHVIKTMNGDNR